MQSPLVGRSPFAPEQAFVAQFGRGTAGDAGRLTGRVEHVVSRKTARFQSLDELVACMIEVLRALEETTRDTD